MRADRRFGRRGWTGRRTRRPRSRSRSPPFSGSAGWLSSRHRAAAVAVGAAVAGAVLWSNALAYRDVSLAPRGQLAELDEIGDLIAGQGPTLVTEYSPYGARHFLRAADPESISELRRRPIELRDGSEVPKGDRPTPTDRAGGALGLPDSGRAALAHGEPPARRVPARLERRLLRRLAAAGDRLRARARSPARRPIRPGRACRRARRFVGSRAGPTGGRADGVGDSEAGRGRADHDGALPGGIETTVDVPERGDYELWLEGSVMPRSRRASTATRSVPLAASSTTAAATSGSATPVSLPASTGSRSISTAPTCIRAAPGSSRPPGDSR